MTKAQAIAKLHVAIEAARATAGVPSRDSTLSRKFSPESGPIRLNPARSD